MRFTISLFLCISIAAYSYAGKAINQRFSLDKLAIQFDVIQDTGRTLKGSRKTRDLDKLIQNRLLQVQSDGAISMRVKRHQNSPSKRIEFREYPGTWSINEGSSIRTDLQLYSSTAEEYTWLQIHEHSAKKVRPPMRLVWLKEKTVKGITYKDYLAAVLYSKQNGYRFIPLMQRPDKPTNIKVMVKKGTLTITADGRNLLETDVSEWKDIDCYFRLGVYMSGGRSKRINQEGVGRILINKIEL